MRCLKKRNNSITIPGWGERIDFLVSQFLNFCYDQLAAEDAEKASPHAKRIKEPTMRRREFLERLLYSPTHQPITNVIIGQEYPIASATLFGNDSDPIQKV